MHWDNTNDIYLYLSPGADKIVKLNVIAVRKTEIKSTYTPPDGGNSKNLVIFHLQI